MTLRLPRFIGDWFRPVVGQVRVPVLSGTNRGRWWSLACAGSGFATGQRELPRMRLIELLIEPGDVAWDIGAHYGYVTLSAARRVRHPAQVHAFEPSHRNRRMLVRHLAWNGLRSVNIHAAALSDFAGVADFGGSGSSQTFALGRGGERVEVRTGASLIESGAVPAPTFVKIDVEGAEAGVLRGLLAKVPPTARMLISMHSLHAMHACQRQLLAHGFRLIPTTHLVKMMTSGRWSADPDLLAIGPESAEPSAHVAAVGDLDVRAHLPFPAT